MVWIIEDFDSMLSSSIIPVYGGLDSEAESASTVLG